MNSEKMSEIGLRKMYVRQGPTKSIITILSGAVIIACLTFLAILYRSEDIYFFLNKSYAENAIDYFEIPFQTMEEKRFTKVPVETLNPNSQFFGLIYKNTYGLPSKYNKDNHENFYQDLSKGLPSWEMFMPDIATSLSQYRLHNPSGYSSAFTSATHSALLVSNLTQFTVGDTFTAQIQARDFLQRNKLFGGDYFRAKLMRTPSRDGDLDDGIPCFVEDHSNGSYIIRAKLPVVGTFKLEATLCASIEAIDAYVRWADGRSHQGFIFEATLLSNEITYCNSDLLTYDKYKNTKPCNYSNPRNREPFFCNRPPSGICFPIKFISPFHSGPNFQDNSWINKPFDINTELREKFHSYETVSGSGSFIKVSPQPALNPSLGKIESRKLNSAIKRPNGYFYNSRWMSYTHNYEFKQLREFVPCFSNKIVYFLGDSTMRQFFDLMANPLNLKVYVNDSSKYYHVPRCGRNEKQNISIYYRAHGLPIRNPGPPSIATYISDTISAIDKGGANVALYINIGLHYLEYNSVIYLHRLNGIKRALSEYSRKHPLTKIIIKGMNVSNLKLYPFEWLIYRQNHILKEFFKDLKHSVFIDLWDMTTLWPLTVDYHPKNEILTQQANIMFGYLCN